MTLKLNEQQEQLANFRTGYAIALASAGSGKTATILERARRIVREGINPASIMILTFSKKSVADLKGRMDSELKDVFVSNFHSLCYRTLKIHGNQKTLVTNWKLIKFFTDKYGEEFAVGDLQSWISFQKSHMNTCDADEFEPKGCSLDEFLLPKYYVEYEEFNREHNFLDFDDMLLEFVKLVSAKQEIQDYFTRQYNYIMVDEHQDSSRVQNEILKLITGCGNLVCIGDIKQCLVPNTVIKTTDGDKLIQDIKVGDKVLSASGRGDVEFGEVEEVSETEKHEDIVSILTESGDVLRGTKDHVLFVNQVIDNRDFIYLLYKKDYGFRIGKTSNYRVTKDGRVASKNGYSKRLTDEDADKVWLIKVTDNSSDTFYWEHYLAYTYGILQYQFKARQKGLNQDTIQKLFNSIPDENAYKLLEDYNLDFNYPHDFRDFSKDKPYNLNFTLFGSKGKNTSNNYLGNKHELNVSTTDTDYAEIIQSLGMTVPKKQNGKGLDYYAFRRVLGDHDKLFEDIQNIESVVGNKLNLKLSAILTESKLRYSYMPMRNIKTGMTVAILKDGKIYEDKITEVTLEKYSGMVYDLNIKDYRNYIANNIVSHNCIYNFRGSDLSICLDFKKDWKDATVIQLPVNYRSTKNIVDVSNNFIRPSFESYELYADATAHKDTLGNISVDYDSGNTVQKVKELLDKGVEPKDIAILFRVNYLGGTYELELREMGIPCEMADDRSFLDRMEIDVIMSYLRLALDNTDYPSFAKVYNTPNRYLGKKFLSTVSTHVGMSKKDLFGLGYELKDKLKSFELRGYKSFAKAVSMINPNGKPANQIDRIIRMTELEKYIKTNFDDYEDKLKSMQLLKKIAKKYKTVKQFMFMIQNLSKDKPKNAVQLMSVHKSKGLEFQHVFVVNADQEVFPHKRSTDSEERRLFYVAISRAIEGLTVTGTGKYVSELMEILDVK